MELIKKTSLKAFDENSYKSKLPANYALEMTSGWFEVNNVGLRSKITGCDFDKFTSR